MTDDGFFLPINYLGKEYNFPARILQYGFTIKVEVTIDDNILLFEPDEERNWRALVPYEQLHEPRTNTDHDLLKTIATALEELTK